MAAQQQQAAADDGDLDAQLDAELLDFCATVPLDMLMEVETDEALVALLVLDEVLSDCEPADTGVTYVEPPAAAGHGGGVMGRQDQQQQASTELLGGGCLAPADDYVWLQFYDGLADFVASMEEESEALADDVSSMIDEFIEGADFEDWMVAEIRGDQDHQQQQQLFGGHGGGEVAAPKPRLEDQLLHLRLN